WPRLGSGRLSRQRALRRRLSPPLPRGCRMRSRKRRAAHEPALAVEQNGLDFDVLARNDGSGGLTGGTRHFVAERNAFGLGMNEGFSRCIGSENVRGKVARAACTFGKLGERHEVDRTAFGVKIEQPLGELG